MRRATLSVRGIKAQWPRLVALRRDRLIVLEGRDMLISLDFDGEKTAVIAAQALGWAPAGIALSPSRRHLLLTSPKGNFAEVRELETLELLTVVAGPERLAAALVAIGEQDVLLHSRRPGQLEAIGVDDLALVFEAQLERPQPFVVEALRSMEDGDTVVAVGHRFLDVDATAAVLSLTALAADPGRAAAAIDAAFAVRRAALVEAGPCGWDEWVCWQLGLGRSGQPSLHIHRLDGGVGTAPGLPADAGTVTAVCGTPRALAVAGGRRLYAIDRGTGEVLAKLRAIATAMDAESGRVVAITDERQLELIQLPVD